MDASGLACKKKLAALLEACRLNCFTLFILNRIYANNYVRIVNYHDVAAENAVIFEKHMQWYAQNYENVDVNKLADFLQGNYLFKKSPGIMLTFDDGFSGNFDNACPILDKYGYTGYFFVSTGLIGLTGYMNKRQLLELATKKHVIGCHTYTHHRININDDEKTLQKEIVQAKTDLEDILGLSVHFFGWVGGEEESYTKSAAEVIRSSGYRYAVMTNSEPVCSKTDPWQLQRTNINDDWELSLVKFQVSGLIDLKYRYKCQRVKKLTRRQ